MKEFEIWVDESGEFLDQKLKQGWNPSLAGGILFEKGKFTEAMAVDCIGRAHVHCNKIKAEVQKDYLIKILEHKSGIRPVVFENTNYTNIADSTITYLHIMTEGLLSLVLRLEEEYNTEVKLYVTIAQRQDMEKKTEDEEKSIPISYDEYPKKLKEKMTIGMIQKFNNTKFDKIFDLKFMTDEQDKRLQCADVICNSWLTRNTKFRHFQGEIQSLMKSTLLIEIFNEKEYLKKLIHEGDIAAIFFEHCSSSDGLPDHSWSRIVKRIKSYDDAIFELQLQIFKEKIKIFVNQKDYALSEKFLKKVEKDIILKLSQEDISLFTLPLDISLFLLTVYSHQNQIEKCNKEYEKSKRLLNDLPSLWEYLEYHFILQNRYAIFFADCFDFQNSNAIIDAAIGQAEALLDAVSLVDGLSGVENLSSETLGKALGTKLSIQLLQLQNEKQLIDEMRETSERAVKQFKAFSDLGRQYQYRANMEYIVGEFDEALKYLRMSLGIEGEEDDFDLLVKKASESRFSIMHYVRIMTFASLNGNSSLSEAMHKSLSGSTIYKELKENKTMGHPAEITFWRIGTYLLQSGSHTAANDFYKNALKVAFAEKSTYTLNVLGLGILADKIAILHSQNAKCDADEKEFFKKYKSLKNATNEFASFKEFFNRFEVLLKGYSKKTPQERSQIMFGITKIIGQ